MEDGRVDSTVRCVEKMEIMQEAPPGFFPFSPPTAELEEDTRSLLQRLSGGGLQDLLIGFFAQQ